MAGKTVTVVNPDTKKAEIVPEESLGRNLEAGARVATPEDVAKTKRDYANRENVSPGETWLAAAHGYSRGAFGAIGIPVDRVATGVADFFGGEDARRSTADYLKGLDERHPLAGGWMELAGGVNTSVGLSELTGLGGLKGLVGVAARAGVAGVENVAQATTRDINEDAIGNASTNGSKLFAKAGERFLLGVGLGLGFEGLAAGAGAVLRALGRKVGPAAEQEASKAIGRELGLGGEEAVAAGNRVRKLSTDAGGPSVPSSRGALVDLLEGSQAAERKAAQEEARKAGQSLVSSAEAQAAEQEGSAAGRAFRQAEEAEGRGLAKIRSAQDSASEGTFEAMAKGGARVEQAELAGASRLKGAYGDMFEANMAAFRAADRAAGEALQEEMAAAGQAYQKVVDRYSRLTQTLAEEHAAATEQALALEAERAANSKALGEALKKSTQEATAPGQLTKAEFEEIVDTMIGITGGRNKRGVDPNQRWAAEQFVRDTYGEPIAEAGAVAGRGPEVERLQAMGESLAKAHEEALSRVKTVEGAMRTTEMQAQKDIATAGKLADQRIAEFQARNQSSLSAAEKAAKKASDNLAKVRQEVASSVEKARGAGNAEAAAAEALGKKRIAQAEREAQALVEKAKAEGQRLTEKAAVQGRAGVAKAQKGAEKLSAQAEKAQTPSGELLAGMRSPGNERPFISPWAFWGSFASAVHGNVLGAAAGLLGGLAAGRARAASNLATARALRAVSETVASVDEAIRNGTAAILGRGASNVAARELSRETPKAPNKKEPSFEEVVDQIKTASVNPGILEHRIQAEMGPIALQAPGAYAATLAAAQRANMFLLSILPPEQKNQKSLTPQLEPGLVPDAMKYDFMRSYKTIVDPLSIYKDIQDGTVVDAQIQALEAVHGDLFNQMRGEVDRQRMRLTSPLDYEKAIQVGTLLGVTTNEVMEPDFQRAMAASYADKQVAGQPVGSRPKSGTKLDRNTLSAAQRLESGESP